MNNPYMSAEEMTELERYLTYKDALDETMSCWVATRIHNRSASLACEGNISILLLKAFDQIKERIGAQEQVKNKESIGHYPFGGDNK